MDQSQPNSFAVAVIGAGPAGLFAARHLAMNGVRVALFNRDIKPGGLAEYGIYPDKLKMKDGLRAQFRLVTGLANVEYYGNVTVGSQGDLSLDDLRELGFQALLVTAGAQGTKWLGLPGEQLQGVYHAKEVVYYYNLLPPYSQRKYEIGKRVAVVGVGNVMLDLAHFLTEKVKVDEVIAVARRGPAEVKFDRKELESVVAYLDMLAVGRELARVAPQMLALGQDPVQFRELIDSARPKAPARQSQSRFTLRFLASPRRILGDEHGHVTGLELEENALTLEAGEVKARGTGSRSVLDVDTVIFAIGDRVDAEFGLPVDGNEYVKNPEPRFPVDDTSYEAMSPEVCCPIDDVFVAGWSRKASTGLVGVARKDGINGATALLQYLATLTPNGVDTLGQLRERIRRLGHPVVTNDDLRRLEAIEQKLALERGQPGFKFSTNEEMLAATGLNERVASD